MGENACGVEWRIVPSAPDYEVSGAGAVRRAVRSYNWPAGRPVKSFPARGVYLCVSIMHPGGVRRLRYVHHLVLEAFAPPRPSALHVGAHNDGDPTNNRFENLRWASVAENNADMALHGTLARGERVHSAKLNEDAVREIRAGSLSLSAFARRYGVHLKTVQAAAQRINWKHVS